MMKGVAGFLWKLPLNVAIMLSGRVSLTLLFEIQEP